MTVPIAGFCERPDSGFLRMKIAGLYGSASGYTIALA
jgi:hypothetical protein